MTRERIRRAPSATTFGVIHGMKGVYDTFELPPSYLRVMRK